MNALPNSMPIEWTIKDQPSIFKTMKIFPENKVPKYDHKINQSNKYQIKYLSNMMHLQTVQIYFQLYIYTSLITNNTQSILDINIK